MAELRNIANFFQTLSRANTHQLAEWTEKENAGRAFLYSCLIIFAGCSLYGFSIGFWRSPLQGIFSGVKLPLVIFLTCLANSLLNTILAMVLGSKLDFRRTSLCILLSFSLFSLIAGAVSPVALFLSLNLPDPVSESSTEGHSLVMVIHTFFIAYAGILGNWKLYQLLQLLTPSPRIARQTLFAWLAGNLFLGAQLTYVLRPFFGNPLAEIQFLRDDPMAGNFYIVLFNSIRTLFDSI